MKDLMRQSVGAQQNILDSLNKQIKLEAKASATYLSMAAWCEQNNFVNAAEFFYGQSDEERGHMLKLFHYISDVGGKPISPEVSEPVTEFTSFREIFETALENEITVTESIHQIVAACRKSGDYASENFMQWFVGEQVEEEMTIRNILGYFDLLQDDPMSLLMIDERISKAVKSAS